MAVQSPLGPPTADALSDVEILECIFTHIHIGHRCCNVRTLEDAYNNLSQEKESRRCVFYMFDLSACSLVSKLWSSVAVPHLWGHYAELHHILSIGYDTFSDYLRHLDEDD
jgi:hypothetical protein